MYSYLISKSINQVKEIITDKKLIINKVNQNNINNDNERVVSVKEGIDGSLYITTACFYKLEDNE